MRFVFWAGLLLLTGCRPESFKGNEYLLQENDGVEITLAFAPAEERFFGKVVNRYFGTYQTQGNRLAFGAVASTLMMGTEEAMKAEQEHFANLAAVREYAAEKDRLILILSDGRRLIFRKKGTAAMR